MIRPLFQTVALVSALVLPACGGDVISGAIHRAGASDHFAASGGRDLKTVIIGNPFKQSKEQADAAIVAAMQGHHPGPRTRFTTTPGPSAIGVYRITIMFDPPRTADAADLCSGQAGAATAAAQGFRLLAAFCADEWPLTSVDALVGSRFESADHPAVHRLIAEVMRELIPAEDPLAFID